MLCFCLTADHHGATIGKSPLSSIGAIIDTTITMGGTPNMEECIRNILQSIPTPPSTGHPGLASSQGGAKPQAYGTTHPPAHGALSDDMSMALAAGELPCLIGHLVLKRAVIPQEALQRIATILLPHVDQEYSDLLAEIANKTGDY